MSEQRSMASLIAGILTEAAGARTDRAALRSRLSAAGLLVVPPGPRRVPSRSAALLGAGGSGHTVSTELGVQRSER